MFFRGLLGTGQGWATTKSAYLEVIEPTAEIAVSSLDAYTSVSTVVDLEFGLGFSNQRLERRTPYVEFWTSWDFQTWINKFSTFNVSLWSLQGLTLSLGYTF